METRARILKLAMLPVLVFTCTNVLPKNAGAPVTFKSGCLITSFLRSGTFSVGQLPLESGCAHEPPRISSGRGGASKIQLLESH